MTRRRAGRLAAGAMALALAVGGCGSDGDSAGELRWNGQPSVMQHPTLRTDHILTGAVRNDGLRVVRLAARDVRLLDAEGHRVNATAVFLRGGYLHSLYPPTRLPAGGVPEREQLRIGRLLKLEPGKTAPLTLSWRVAPGENPPVRADYGSGSLPIPKGAGRTGVSIPGSQLPSGRSRVRR
jgi:hypothetical protein